MPGDAVLDAVVGLPARFNPNGTGLVSGRFRLRIDDLVRDVVVHKTSCVVEDPTGQPDAEIATDATTWLRIEAGEMTGIDAFAAESLSVRGSIERSLLFEVMFDRQNGGRAGYEMESVSLGGTHLSALTMGPRDAQTLLLVHGLGATKASWLPVVPALARRYRVIVVDLPGFGASSKPRGAYNAPFFAEHMFRFMDMVDLRSAYVAGNSLGGRVAMEMALLEPERVNAIACLCPAAAFTRRPFSRLVRVLRPELGMFASRIPRDQLRTSMKHLFAEPDRIPDAWYEAALDDFLNIWRSPRARRAFFATLRNVYLDEPEGDQGFWTRLRAMKTPSLFVYGARDALITSRFAEVVESHLPLALVEVWDHCGHVPQLEYPERAVERISSFFGATTRAA